MKNNSNEIIFEFDLSGFDRKEIDVKIKEGEIYIIANKKDEKRKKEKDFSSYEKISKSFKYISTLPKIEKDKAKIDFDKGILKIIIPKK